MSTSPRTGSLNSLARSRTRTLRPAPASTLAKRSPAESAADRHNIVGTHERTPQPRSYAWRGDGSIRRTASSHLARSGRHGSVDLQQLIERLVGRYFLSVHQWLFETTDGRITWLGGLPALLLRTTGRKTGAERTAALVSGRQGPRRRRLERRQPSPARVVAKYQKTPTVGVQIGRERRQMKARVANPAERARL